MREEERLRELLQKMASSSVGERIEFEGVIIEREPWCYKITGNRGMRRIGLQLTERSVKLALRFVKEGRL